MIAKRKFDEGNKWASKEVSYETIRSLKIAGGPIIQKRKKHAWRAQKISGQAFYHKKSS